MKHENPFKSLSKFELALWITSLAVVGGSFVFSSGGVFALAASLIGVTALIFIAKGHVLGQLLTIVFSVLYGVISFRSRYYGEMITYLGMTAPMAAAALVSWLRHPFGKTAEVEINRVTKRQTAILLLLTAAVTAAFYFILKAFGTARLAYSTLSVATSFFAASLTFLRSPYYAAAYAVNDLVLIALWIFAAAQDMSSLPMIFCFIMFFVNDSYGFINWRRIQRRQESGQYGSPN
jgi:nicotinamide mononucleotide transporter PnuC